MIQDIRTDKGAPGPSYLVSDWGAMECPAELEAAMDAAPKRKNGRLDLRTRLGREARRLEAEALAEARRRFEAANPHGSGRPHHGA